MVVGMVVVWMVVRGGGWDGGDGVGGDKHYK